MMTARRKNSTNFDSGFTLVEMLIALFIFSVISVGSMTALTGALRGKEQVKMRMDKAAMRDTARALIAADMNNLILYAARDPLGTPERYLLVGGDDSLISFTRAGRSNPGALEARGNLQRVEYRFSDGAIIRRALASANPGPDVAVIDRVLYDNVQNADIEFNLTPNIREQAGGSLGNLLAKMPQIQVFNPPQPSALTLRYITLSITFNDGQTLTQNFEVLL